MEYSIREKFDLEIKIRDRRSQYRRHLDSYKYVPFLTPLEFAIRGCYYPMVKLLVENGAKIDQTHITRASQHGCHAYMSKHIHSEVFSFFLKSENARTKGFRAALQMGHDELIDIVSTNKRAEIPSLYSQILTFIELSVRRCKENMPIMQLLLDKGAERGWCLHLPSDSTNNLIVPCDVTLRFILEKQSLTIPTASSISSDAMCYAAFYGNKPLLNLFLKMGAEPNFLGNWYDWQGAPLALAAYSGQFEMVKILLEKGADANLTFEPGITALEMARTISKNSLHYYEQSLWVEDTEEKGKIVEYLLELGAKE